MDHYEEAICLARTAQGIVKICPTGCTHATFSRVTFDFDTPAEFQEMARKISRQKDSIQEGLEFRFDHGIMTLELPAQAASELVKLVTDASTALSWSDGDMQLSEESLQRFLLDPEK